MAKKQSSSLSNDGYMNFLFVGTSTKDKAGKTFSSNIAYPRFVKGIEEIANVVFDVCIVNELIPRHVMIVTHGSTEGFEVGLDYIDRKTLENQHGESFKKLGLLMLPSTSSLELYSCQVGKNRSLLRKISNLLGNVAVKAYEENQPASGEGRGQAISCTIDKCKPVKKKK